LPYETSSRLSQTTIAQLAEMIGRHPRFALPMFPGQPHAESIPLRSGARTAHLSLLAIWWHNFFPDAIRQLIAERLASCHSTNRSDFSRTPTASSGLTAKASCRKQLARVLAEKIEQTQFTFDEAVGVARRDSL